MNNNNIIGKTINNWTFIAFDHMIKYTTLFINADAIYAAIFIL